VPFVGANPMLNGLHLVYWPHRGGSLRRRCGPRTGVYGVVCDQLEVGGVADADARRAAPGRADSGCAAGGLGAVTDLWKGWWHSPHGPMPTRQRRPDRRRSAVIAGPPRRSRCPGGCRCLRGLQRCTRRRGFGPRPAGTRLVLSWRRMLTPWPGCGRPTSGGSSRLPCWSTGDGTVRGLHDR
jgi:hypothetical protein